MGFGLVIFRVVGVCLLGLGCVVLVGLVWFVVVGLVAAVGFGDLVGLVVCGELVVLFWVFGVGFVLDWFACCFGFGLLGLIDCFGFVYWCMDLFGCLFWIMDLVFGCCIVFVVCLGLVCCFFIGLICWFCWIVWLVGCALGWVCLLGVVCLGWIEVCFALWGLWYCELLLFWLGLFACVVCGCCLLFVG